MAKAAVAYEPAPSGKAEPNRHAPNAYAALAAGLDTGHGEPDMSIVQTVDTGPGWTGLQRTITFTPHDTSPGS